MVNNLILLINFVGLFLLGTFLGTDPTVVQSLPASMEPGSEARVTVTITKGDLGGFAKLQLDLPPGLSITALETKGASFTFADQKAKFIWMALPSGPSFKVTYTLKADATASGIKTINGRLSYIEENERKTYDLATAEIDLGSAKATGTTTRVVEMGDDEVSPGDLVSAAGGAPVGSIMVAVVEQASGVAAIQGAGGISGTRTITPVSESEMLVEVTINKADIRGFGKLQETVPQGFRAVESQSSDAIFTTQDRIVKFVWLNLPAQKMVTVVYTLRADQRPHGEYSIDGEFGYLLNDETQKAVLGTSRFYVGPKALELLAQEGSDMNAMDNPDALLAAKQKAEREAQAKADQEAAQAKAEAAKAKDEATNAAALAQREQAKAQESTQAAVPAAPKTSPVPSIPAPEKGVNYKVQITAAHREVGRAYFQARHRYSGDFNIERHQGWIKYVTGSDATYQGARDLRNNLVQAGHEFPGPFVTAYNNGERITVQEALMLSNQQWVQ